MLRKLQEQVELHAAQLAAARPARSPGVLTQITTNGVFRRPTATSAPAGSRLQFRNQWVDQAYAKNDIVIRETNPELDDGNKAGTYIASEAVSTGDLAPGEEDSGSSAEFGVVQW